MKRRFSAYECSYLLSAGLCLAAGWMYWHQQPSCNAWVAEPPERIVSGAIVGQELHVAFVLRNTASQPRRILGVGAC